MRIRNNSVNRLKRTSQQDKNFINHKYTRQLEKSVIEKYREYIEDLTSSIRLFPEDYILFFNRATLKVRIGDIKGARSDFRMSEYIHINSDVITRR